MYYMIKERLVPLEDKPQGDLTVKTVQIVTLKEWQTSGATSSVHAESFKSYANIHLCKLENYADYMLGSFCIPSKQNSKQKKRFIYYIHKDGIVFVDDSDLVKALLEKMSHTRTWDTPTLETFFSNFLELLIDKDLLYLEELENRIAKMESTILNGEITHFNHTLMDFRKELLTLHYYYSQLVEVGEVLGENENDFFNEHNLRLFDFFTRRVSRLQSNVQMLREYALQVREEYQSQIDIKQNNTMRILTVVTTIFLPLTLIAGWYGMNFTYMPELRWKYGYPLVIAISLAIICLSIWICKKKKFL